VRSPEVRAIAFTGSPAAGQRVAVAAGAKRLVLELGGNAATIVCADADLDEAARVCAETGYSNSGQSCVSVQRVYVERSRFEDFVARFRRCASQLRVGDPLDPATDVGTMVDPAAAARVREWVAEAVTAGARLELGGTVSGATLSPTLLACPPATARVVTEEVFGALVSVMPFDEFGDALREANATPNGLQGGLFTRDIGRVFEAARDFEVGGLVVKLPARPRPLRRGEGLRHRAREPALDGGGLHGAADGDLPGCIAVGLSGPRRPAMRAAVLEAPGRLEVRRVPAPGCRAGHVLVEVLGVGICGTDLSLFAGHRSFPAPLVIGHEGFGRITRVGPDVDGLRTGQLVAVEPNLVCGACERCRAGRTALCVRKVSLGVDADGLCAEYAEVPAEFAWPLPDGITPADAVCVEPLAVALAAIRVAEPRPAEHVAVLGAGSQGLLLTAALHHLGIAAHVVDPRVDRLQLALRCGAASAAESATALDASCVFETSGAAEAVQTAVSLAPPDARIVLIGIGHRPAQLDIATVVRRCLRLQGALIYEHPADFAMAVELVSRGELSPGRVVARAFPLARASEALRLAPGVAGKSWITLATGRHEEEYSA